MKEIHAPKKINSTRGLGLPSNTIEHTINKDILVSQETWNSVESPWKESGVVIAKKGYIWLTEWKEDRNYIVTRIIDDKGNIVAYYFDVCSPINRKNNEFSFEDWYLDIWYCLNEKPTILDEDELKQALQKDFINKQQYETALDTANYIIENINDITNF